MFSLYVPLKRIGMTAGDATVTTFEGFFLSVLALVSFKITNLSGSIAAQTTLEWLLF